MQEKQVLIQTKMLHTRSEVKKCYGLSSSSFFFILSLSSSSYAELTDKDVNFEGIKSSLIDPHGVLINWDVTAVDPCSWNMVTCSADGFVLNLLLQNNYITGHIPHEIGKLMKLKPLDLSTNNFTGQIPLTLSNSRNLQYLRLNNNNLTGTIPSSLANMTQLTFLDLSYNSLSGPVPRSLTRPFNVIGNPQFCPTGTEKDCWPMPLTLNSSQNESSNGGTKNPKIAIAFVLFFFFAKTIAFGLSL